MAKTIVFCNDIDHAERMRRALINLNPEQVAKNDKYVMKITGDDEIGKAQLDNFINPKKAYPVIATTSELMSTGVDAKTCKLIVLDQNIQPMTKFKQIIDRGTRIDEKYNKLWFTILDFKKATELFADEDFDGPPEKILNTKPEVIIDELATEGVIWDALEDDISKDLDPFDLIYHIAFDQPSLTRQERANNVKKCNYFTKYSETAQKVLNALLDQYADEGVKAIEGKNALKANTIVPFGRPLEIAKKAFGGPQKYNTAITELETKLYSDKPGRLG